MIAIGGSTTDDRTDHRAEYRTDVRPPSLTTVGADAPVGVGDIDRTWAWGYNHRYIGWCLNGLWGDSHR